MAHAMLRATSVGASALLVGAAMIAAFSITSHVWTPPPFDDAKPIVVERVLIPPPPQPPEVRETTPRPVTTTFTGPAPLTDPISTADPMETALPVATTYVATGPMEITDPHWTRRPSDLARYYPDRAIARGIEGEVLLDCLVGVDGALTCSVTSETPPDWGFARAALRISRDYRMNPAMVDGVAVEGRYRMRVPFNVQQ